VVAGGLTLEEARDAYRRGLARHAYARSRRSVHRFGLSDRRSASEIRHADACAAVAEAAVAVAVGGVWLSAGVLPDPRGGADVRGPDGTGYSVRWTTRERGCLIVHPDDLDYLVGVLVTGEPPALRIVGGIPLEQAKRPE
jgi:hypothetical protein